MHNLKHEEPVSSPSQELERLFEEHHTQVFRTAYRITGSPADAEDVMQTVFLRLLKRYGEWRVDLGIGGYLRRAAVNAALDLLRVRKRREVVSLADGHEELEDPAGIGPERSQHQRELRNQLRQALARLNPRAAEILILRFFEGYGNGEIATLVGSSRASIAVSLHRSRRRLKKELAPLLGGMS